MKCAFHLLKIDSCHTWQKGEKAEVFYHLLILSMSTCPGGKSYANSGLKVFFVQLNIMYGPSYSILKSTFFKSKVYLKKKDFI